MIGGLCVRGGGGVERRAYGVWLIADGKSERGPAGYSCLFSCSGLSGLIHSSNHINHINQKNQTDEMNQRDQINQLPATRREMLDCKTCPSVFATGSRVGAFVVHLPFGFHARSRFCASAICSGGICLASASRSAAPRCAPFAAPRLYHM